MADLTVELVEGSSSPLAQKVYLTPPMSVSGKGTVLMFSGGIGHYYYNPLQIRSLADATIHDDVGPLLADSLRRHPALSSYQVLPPAETLRATVLGASTQTVTLSGSTIWAEREILPMKNVPVIRPILRAEQSEPAGELSRSAASSARLSPAAPLSAQAISTAITEALRRWDVDLKTDPFAVALELVGSLDYEALTRLADGLNEFSAGMPAERPLVVIIERDYAQALGQTLKGLAPHRSLLVIDQVGLSEGDYIDLGTPLMDGRVVPLSVKTLIFYH
jgi:ethanolamine utilization protein EutA